MTIGQYTPQTALGRVDFGMRAASAGKDPMAALQTLAMNDQLLRQREQEMHMKSLAAQAKQQEAALKAQTAEAERQAGIVTGVQEYLDTNGKYLSGLITSGDTKGYENALHGLGASLGATPEELMAAAPFGDQAAISNYATQAQNSASYGFTHDEKSVSDAALETQKSALTEGRDIRGDARQAAIDLIRDKENDEREAEINLERDTKKLEQQAAIDLKRDTAMLDKEAKIAQAKEVNSRLREDIINMGGNFSTETVASIYVRGMGTEAVNESVTAARSVLTKILGKSDLAAKEMKNKQQGGVETDSPSFKFGVALQKEYTKNVDADVRVWNSMTPTQKLLDPSKRPLNPDEYRTAALEKVVSMTTLDGTPQAYVTKALEKDRKIFANEMMRSPDPVIVEEVGVVMDLLFTTEPYRRMSQALNEGRITQAQALKLEEEMLQEILVAKFYGNPVVRGMVTGSEFQKSKKSVRQIRNKGR